MRLVVLKVFAPMVETLRKNVRRTGRQQLSARSHFPIHGSTVPFCKYMMCVFSVLWCSALANGELACEDHEDPAILLQYGGVHDKVNLATMVDAQGVKDIDMEVVTQCLRLTTPELQTLKYPKDAEEHFEALHKVLAPWVQLAAKDHATCYHAYCGPWIENQWIGAHFMSQNRSGKKSTKPLAEDFGPFIPILMPWTDLLNIDSLEYDKMIHTLRKNLRPDVAYITISQFWSGLVGRHHELSDQREIMKTIPNVLVMSAGGYGHVPIPHLRQELRFLDGSVFKPMAKRDLLVSFLGSYGTDRHGFRLRMKTMVKEEAKTLGVKVDLHMDMEKSDVWQRFDANSKVSLCPRGKGRTSYRLFEILQLGLIPIHVYHDIPWLPYTDLYPKIGFSTDLDGLPKLLEKINDMDLQELERMEEQIRSFRATHFTYEGVLNQISLFMKNGSDLRCQKLPETWHGF